MALPPINGRPSQLPATTAPGTSDARSAAQRAFFQAALNKAGAAAPTSAPVRTAAPQAAAPASRAVQPAVTRVTNETLAQQPQPTRILRPGSIIDIKV